MNIETVTNLYTNEVIENRGISPLIDCFGYEKDQQNRIKNYAVILHEGRLAVSLAKNDIKYNLPLFSIKDLYDLIINTTTPTLVDINGQGINDDMVLSVHINKAANTIACCTRRGAGNVIIAGSNIIKILSSILKPENIVIPKNLSKMELELFYGDIKPVINYKETSYKGTLNDSIRVYESTDLDKDTLILAYSNNTVLPDLSLLVDGGLSAVVDENGKVFLQTHSNGICAWSDYFSVIKLI